MADEREREKEPSLTEKINRAGLMMSNDPEMEPHRRILSAVYELSKKLDELDGAVGEGRKRFEEEDRSREKKERRDKGVKYWNASLDKMGKSRDEAVRAAHHIVLKAKEYGQKEGYSDEKIAEMIDDELDDLMEGCEKDGRDPVAVVRAMAEKMGYSPAKAAEIVKDAEKDKKEEEGGGGEKTEGREEDDDEDGEVREVGGNPDADEVMKRSKTTPNGSGAGAKEDDQETRLKKKRSNGSKSVEEYYRNLASK